MVRRMICSTIKGWRGGKVVSSWMLFAVRNQLLSLSDGVKKSGERFGLAKIAQIFIGLAQASLIEQKKTIFLD